MGKLINHGPGAVEKIMFPAGIGIGQPGNLIIQGHGPEDSMEGKLFLFQEAETVVMDCI